METIEKAIVWHLCKKDGLPPVGEKVLVCCVNRKGEPFVCVGKRDENHWLVSGSVYGVHAWAKIPLLPISSYVAAPCIQCQNARWNLDRGGYVCRLTHLRVKSKDTELCEYFSDRPEQDTEEDAE